MIIISNMGYHTTQKQAVLDWVKSRKDHPTAQEIYEGVKQGLPNISFATVYRNLNALAQEGQINEVQFVDHVKRYESETHPHQHFICQKCTRIVDMELSELLNVPQVASKMKCHKVESFHLELIGTCAACIK